MAEPWIGRAVRRREDGPLIRGAARFVDDLVLPEMAYVAFVRSPHARAQVLDVRAPVGAGVIAVITADDMVGRARPFAVMTPRGASVADAPHPILAGAEVRYVGQPVAAVIAESREAAADAVELVEVSYEPASAAPSSEDLLFLEASGGDVEEAFAAAAHVVRAHHAIPRLAAAPLEPRGVVAAYDAGADLLTIWASAQDPHRPLEQLAHALGRAEDTIRVVVPHVGGAFGSKGVIAPEAVTVAFAAIELGRPLKWVEERWENLVGTYQGRGVEADVELALDGDGRILGVRAAIVADLGAYLLPTTPLPPNTMAMLMTGCYDVQACSVVVRGARTDKVPTGPYRGAGRPEAAYVLERTIDLAASEVGIEPAELRRRNLISSFPYSTPLAWTYDSGDYARLLEAALELAEPERHADASRLVGTGVAMYVERGGGQWESAHVSVEPDGRVLARSGSSPHGQGHETTFAQILADRLGVAPEDVSLRFGDSAAVPRGVGTFGSRSLAMGGSALVLAAIDIRTKAARIARELLGGGEVSWEDGFFRCSDGRTVSLADVAAAAYDARRLPAGLEPGLESVARFRSDFVFTSGAYAAVVEIDRATGALTVRRVVAVDDAGTIVNPLLAEGQVVGGVLQGLGASLMEEVVYDADGQMRNASFAEYSLPGAAEQPPIITRFIQTPSPLNPLGAKGVGEGGAIGTPAAIGNAVADALGLIGAPVPDPPFTAEKLWRAMAAGRAR